MLRSGFKVKGLKPRTTKLHVLVEIQFDLATFCQDKKIDLYNVLVWLFVPVIRFFGAFKYAISQVWHTCKIFTPDTCMLQTIIFTWAEGPSRFLRIFFIFLLFSQKDRNAFWEYFSVFYHLSKRTATLFKYLFHSFTFFKKDHIAFWGHYSLKSSAKDVFT